MARRAPFDHRRVVQLRLGRRRTQTLFQYANDGRRESRQSAGTPQARYVQRGSRGGWQRSAVLRDRQRLATPVEYSEGIFLRRFPISQICSVYETNAARRVFDRHIHIENPRGYDYERFPYGNDVGFLSELAAAGGGVELIPERLVTLVLSTSSMTRRALREHIWQHRWQYTFNLLRVWRWWRERDVPGAARICEMAERRLALCSLMLGGEGARFRPSTYSKAIRAYVEFRRLDYQRTHSTLEEHRVTIAGRRHGANRPSHSLT
jgi:hypothetical protein